ncbi:MAG: TIGR00730 family Rossman fold protein [Alphaproteobacteria bacterium]|nr:TIGR00730 family Rossman fold protein [Alphaproteobacteria bacterium]
MANKKLSLAVYCGHQFGTNPHFTRDAARIGELMAENGIRLVFGGGDVGLMGTVANAVINNGGDAIGVTTGHVLAKQEPMHEHIETEIAKNISDRRQRMYELSDAFCILPGGTGTLDELTDILVRQQIGETRKPLYFLNTDGYWDIFGRTITHMLENGFIADINDYDMKVFNKPEDVIKEFLKDFK